MTIKRNLPAFIFTLFLSGTLAADNSPPTINGETCLASTWGKTINLLSSNGVELFVYPNKQQRLYAEIPIENYQAHHAQYDVTVYQDCRISLRAHANGKWVAATPYLAAARDTPDATTRYSVTATQADGYRLQSASDTSKTLNINVVSLVSEPAALAEPTLIQAMIRGSRAQPDPIETQLRTLEQTGQLRILRVLESFPLQFEVEGAAAIIQPLQSDGF